MLPHSLHVNFVSIVLLLSFFIDLMVHVYSIYLKYAGKQKKDADFYIDVWNIFMQWPILRGNNIIGTLKISYNY